MEDAQVERAAAEIGGLPEWAQIVIRELKDQAAARTAELTAAQSAASDAAALAEAERIGREQAANEAAALKPHAERAAVLDAYVASAVATRIERLPDAFKPLVPAYTDPLQTLAWLDANAAVLNAPRPPGLDAGVQGEGRAARISDGEREIARKLGVSAARYAEVKRG